jgi:hypothetical protein
MYLIHTDNVLINQKVPFYSIDELKIKKSLQGHPVLELGGLVDSEKYENLDGLNWLNQTISIRFSNDIKPEESIPIFNGFITKVTFQKRGMDLRCQIEGIGFSAKMDRKNEIRIFQNTQQTYGNILDSLLKNYASDLKLVKSGQTDGQNIQDLLIQYEETDWEFLLRICRRMKSICFMADEKIPAKIYLEPQETEKLDTQYFDISAVSDSEEIQIKSREIYYLGNKLTFLNRSYLICELVHYLKNNIIISEYILKNKAWNSDDTSIPNLNSAALWANVESNEDEKRLGRVKLKFENEDPSAGSNLFPVHTPYSSDEGDSATGFYSIPEKGESVLVKFSENEEKSAYVSAVMRQKPVKADVNPNTKIWRNRKGREFRMDDELIQISAKDKEVFIKLDDQRIFVKNKNTSAEISEKHISLDFGNSKILLNGKKISIESNGSHIELNSSGIELKGGTIKLN